MLMLAFSRLHTTRPPRLASEWAACIVIAGAALTTALPVPAATIAPANLPPTFCDDTIAGDLLLNSSMQFDTDSASCTEVVAQAGTTALCVIRYNNVTVTGTGSLFFLGSRPAVLAAQGNMTILGGITVAAGSDFITASGGQGLSKAGGGGAGGSTIGGTGGFSDLGASGGSGGAARGSRKLHPLLGGARGGVGGGSTTTPGGVGGGALELVACGTLMVAANVFAGGVGGQGGQGASGLADANGGGGGGGGGGLLLEGDTVTVTADLIANGGGGGGGGTTNFSSSGNSGGSGNAGYSLTAASGGPAGSTSAGMGGNGGAKGSFPSSGANASTSFGAGGGGGGSAGRIRIDFCNSQSNDASLISPAASIGISCADVIFRDDFESDI